MEKVYIGLLVLLAVGVGVTANSVAAVWGEQVNKLTTPWFYILLSISPFVFITFGLVTSRIGMAIGSGTVDALLTVSTVLVGLFIFKEWDVLNVYQILGLFFIIFGMILLYVKNI